MNQDTNNGVADVAAGQSAKRMDPQIKAQWIAALRSGEYRQGWGKLNGEGNFCCLGVLCDLAVKAGLPLTVVEDKKAGLTRYGGVIAIPPYQVEEWAGIPEADPVVNGTSLSEHNDNGAEFAEIADLIDEHL